MRYTGIIEEMETSPNNKRIQITYDEVRCLLLGPEEAATAKIGDSIEVTTNLQNQVVCVSINGIQVR